MRFQNKNTIYNETKEKEKERKFGVYRTLSKQR